LAVCELLWGSVVASLTKAWLAEFLLVRGIVPSPDGRRLFRYQVTDEEFSALSGLLRNSMSERTSPIHVGTWAAAYCLFVAEMYRREYDGGTGGWSWQSFDQAIGVALTPQDHSHLTRQGLAYWMRPVHERTNGFDYLGSLFDEGGLPWKLLSSDTYGISKAVKGGVHAYYREAARGTHLFDAIRRYDAFFPQSFRNEDKFQLIADIVMWLVGLAERYPLTGQEDPAAYLDSCAPDWRTAAPLPINSENGRNLANFWLKDASQRRRERQQLEHDLRNFTCEHELLSEQLEKWQLRTTVYLPKSMNINLDELVLSSCRVEVMFFEGKSLLTKAGVVYGEYREESNQLYVEFSHRRLQIERLDPQEPLTLKLFAGGQLVAAQYIDFSDVPHRDQPLIFVERDSLRTLAANASAILPESEVWLHLPRGAQLITEGPTQSLGDDLDGGQWLEITDDATVTVGDSHYRIELGIAASSLAPRLHGMLSRFDTLPGLTFHGWPVLLGSEQQPLTGYRTVIDGHICGGRDKHPVCGVVQFQAIDEQGSTILRKTVGILPDKLKIRAYAGTRSSPARLIVCSPVDIDCSIQNDGIQSSSRMVGRDRVFDLESRVGKHPPRDIYLQLRSLGGEIQPVTVRLPFPEAGVQFVDRRGQSQASKRVAINDLLGMELVLTASGESVEAFHVTLSPKASRRVAVQRNYQFRVGKEPLRVSAYSFKEDIENLMAAVPEQDVEVRLQVSTSTPLAQVDVTRYGASLVASPDNSSVELEGADPEAATEGAVLAMSLGDPALAPIVLSERTSECVGTGRYDIPHKLDSDGPWLLVPPKAACKQYRPLLWPSGITNGGIAEPGASTTLHTAARTYHPRDNPDVFDRVISAMASDPSHSGWGYLLELYENFGYLPLSAFESWRVLARNPEALAMIIYRLDLPQKFSRQCMHELSVVWEAIPISVWRRAEAHYGEFFRERGIEQALLADLLDTKRNRLAGITPAHKFLGNGDPGLGSLTLAMAIQVLSIRYMELRRRNAHNDDWPTYLTEELSGWIERQSLPDEIKRLPQVGFHEAVTYLPIFLGAVAAGITELDDLGADPCELRAALHIVADFDRDAWFEPVYEITLAYLLTTVSPD